MDGRITLADVRGPFGNPSSDSARTMLTEGATRALLVVFAPVEVPPEASNTCSRSRPRQSRIAAGAETLAESYDPCRPSRRSSTPSVFRDGWRQPFGHVSSDW